MSLRSRASRAKVFGVAAVALFVLLGALRLVTRARSGPPQRAIGQVAGCPRVEPPERTGAIVSDALDEISGLVASRTQPDVYWVHNDSGDGARVFAVDATGALRAEVKLAGADARDYEDIARGPGTASNEDVLYVADIGDNLGLRSRVHLYALAEPRIVGTGVAVLTAPTKRIEVRYEDGPRDAEALLVDPRRNDLYIVEKVGLFSRRAEAGVYRLAAEEVQRGKVVARRVAEVPLGPVTAGDVAPDGSAVLLRNYWMALHFRREGSEPLAATFARAGCAVPLADAGRQGEAIGFAADGQSYFTVSEGARSPLHRHVFVR